MKAIENFHYLIAAAAPTGGAQGGGPEMMLMMILMFVIMYFVVFRPQKKRQKELEQRIAAIKVGDKVITAGGLHGTVANVKNKTIILKVHDGSKLEFEKSSVATTFPKGTETDETSSSDAVEVDSPASS